MNGIFAFGCLVARTSFAQLLMAFDAEDRVELEAFFGRTL